MRRSARSGLYVLPPLALLSVVAIFMTLPTPPNEAADVPAPVKLVKSNSDGVSLSVSKTTVKTGTWVQVSWSNIPDSAVNNGSGDYICSQDTHCKTVAEVNSWVGCFVEGADISPIGPQAWPTGNPPWLATSPLMWKPVSSPEGQTSFYLEATRHNLVFHLFGNGTTSPVYLASTPVVEFTDIDAPQHVHLARTKSHTEMRVSWQSRQLSQGMVKWGTSPGMHDSTVNASPATYTRGDLCGPPATTHGWHDPGFFYTAVITGLEEGQEVYYTVGSAEHGFTPEQHFKAPVKPSATANLHITAIADVGETYIDGAQYHWMEPYAINTTNNVVVAWEEDHLPKGLRRLALNPKNMAGTRSGRTSPPGGNILSGLGSRQQLSATSGSGGTDVLVHIGDIAYATGYGTEWDRFMAQIEPIASRVPYMTGLGNHERDYPHSGDKWGGGDSGGECGVPTNHRFLMPTPSRQQANGWYSFDQGPVHFIMMDTELQYGEGSDQFLFLQVDLNAVDRSVTPWVILMGHRPMYSGATFDKSFADVETLSMQHKVDLCLWGHVHNAQVTCPVYNGSCVTDQDSSGYSAPVHAVIGNGGQSLSRFPATLPDWSVYAAKEWGYSTIEVTGGKTMLMRLYEDKTNDLHYEFTLSRTESQVPAAPEERQAPESSSF